MFLEKMIKAAVALIFSVVAVSVEAGDTLVPGASLHANQSISSNLGRYQLILQGDGNLVYYRVSDWKPRWTTASNVGVFAPMQTDGNFVLYSESLVPLWNSGTSGYSGAALIAQDDGNLVIYSNGRALWNIGPDPTNVDPMLAGDVVLRDLDVPILEGAFGHIGLWDGANVIEMLNEPGANYVKYNALSNFKQRTTYRGRGSPSIPAYNSSGCYDPSFCGQNSYATVSSRVAIIKRVLQIYGIGADYTLAAQYTRAAAKAYAGPNLPNIQGVRGLYRCDTFILDVFDPAGSTRPYVGPSGEQVPPSGSAVVKWFNFNAGALRSTILPTIIFNKLKDYT